MWLGHDSSPMTRTGLGLETVQTRTRQWPDSSLHDVRVWRLSAFLQSKFKITKPTSYTWQIKLTSNLIHLSYSTNQPKSIIILGLPGLGLGGSWLGLDSSPTAPRTRTWLGLETCRTRTWLGLGKGRTRCISDSGCKVFVYWLKHSWNCPNCGQDSKQN